MSWVWQVWCWQYHCLYIHDNHSSLPCPIVCHGSDRCGADTVSVTVFIFMTITLPYLALVHVMGLTGVVLTLSVSPSLSSWQSHLPTLPWHVWWVQQGRCWQTPWPTSPGPQPCPAGLCSWCCSASGSASPVGWSAGWGTCRTPPAFPPPQSAYQKETGGPMMCQ